MLKTRFLVAVLFGTLLISRLSACAPRPTTAEARSDLPRDTAPTVTPVDLTAIAAGNTAFAVDLYQQLRAGDAGNFFFSPYSLSSALAMTYAGARGDTEQQMAAALHYLLTQVQLHPAFNALDLSLNAPAADDAAFTLRTANSLWGQQDFGFLPAFLDLLARNYGAGLRLVDFQNDATREAARQAINDWVANATEDKIQNLIGEGALTADTRLVLANAIYFKGEWQVPFEPDSPQGRFTLPSGETVDVTMMDRHAQTPYAEGPGYQAVALPYQGDRAEMVVIVPEDLAAFEAALTAKRLNQIIEALEPNDVQLFLPRFTFETELDLADTLAGLGMPDAFDANRADFSGMTGERNIVLSRVIHKAVVAVDELGTEAAAATAVIGEVAGAMPGEPIVVSADRPFLFAIRDTETGTILFLGRVVDPR